MKKRRLNCIFLGNKGKNIRRNIRYYLESNTWINETLKYLVRAISYKDKTEFLIEFKKVYNACSQEEALQLLEAMKKKWEKYSVLLQDWFYDIDVWGKYFKYLYPLRKLIYSTNVIENFNGLIKSNIGKRRVYFTQKSAEISIFLAIQNKQKSLKKVRNFAHLRIELAAFFGEKRIPIFRKFI